MYAQLMLHLEASITICSKLYDFLEQHVCKNFQSLSVNDIAIILDLTAAASNQACRIFTGSKLDFHFARIAEASLSLTEAADVICLGRKLARVRIEHVLQTS